MEFPAWRARAGRCPASAGAVAVGGALSPATRGEHGRRAGTVAAVKADDGAGIGHEGGGERSTELERLRSELRTIQSSRSWRITSPLRQAGAVARTLRSRARPDFTLPASPRRQRRASLPEPPLPGTHSTAKLSSELAGELGRQPGWMYPWSLAPGADAPLVHPVLPSVHRTRAEMIEPAVRAALADAGPKATALDLACS